MITTILTKQFKIGGVDFKLIIDNEGIECFSIALIAQDGCTKALVDETTRETEAEALQVWERLSVARLMRWVETRQQFDVLG